MEGQNNGGPIQYKQRAKAVPSHIHIHMHVCVCVCVCVCVFVLSGSIQYKQRARGAESYTHTHTQHRQHTQLCVYGFTHNTCMYRSQYKTSSLQGFTIIRVCVCVCVCVCACVRVKKYICIGVNSIQAACKRCGVTKRRGRPPSNADSENMVLCV
jgi:hypothetical protein